MFQGADVSGLDKMANKAQEGADLARTVAMALKILVRALEAMSWTGFAAAFAAYLEGVVIPWVETTGKALERFANILQAASALQKSVSEDSPQISVPASAYTPVDMPASTSVNPPLLTAPEYAINNSAMPTAATGAGGPVAAPSAVGGTQSSLGESAATGGGATVATPGGVGSTWDGSGKLGLATGTPAVRMHIDNATITVGQADGGGSVSWGSSHSPGVSAGLGAGLSAAGTSGASGQGSGGGAPIAPRLPASFGTTSASIGSISGADGGGMGGGSAVSGSTFQPSAGVSSGSIGSSGSSGGSGSLGSSASLGGSGSPAGGSSGSGGGGGAGEPIGTGSGALGSGSSGVSGGGSGATGTGTGENLASGDPAIMRTSIPASTGSLGSTGQPSPGVLTGGGTGGDGPGGGAQAAMVAAPLGVAGAGAAALGGLRGKRAGAGEEVGDS